MEVADTKSSVVDVVTEADRASEALIRSLLARARPDDAFLGEEGSDDAGTSGVRWVVDPIDGTVNFLYDLPQYAVSIAAERDGEAVAGVVVNAATGVEYAAALGAGATRDGRPIAVRGTVPLAERLIFTGFSYDADRRAVQAAALVRLLPRVRDVRRLGSCALDLCHVAEGQADGYVEEAVNLWDHAAGGLIAREAGAPHGAAARGRGPRRARGGAGRGLRRAAGGRDRRGFPGLSGPGNSPRRQGVPRHVLIPPYQGWAEWCTICPAVRQQG